LFSHFDTGEAALPDKPTEAPTRVSDQIPPDKRI
jgi:hypothetical protein